MAVDTKSKRAAALKFWQPHLYGVNPSGTVDRYAALKAYPGVAATGYSWTVTEQADALYDIAYGEDIGGVHDDIEAAYMKVQLPDMTGKVPVGALWQAWCDYNSLPGTGVADSVYCDVAGNEPGGGWNESSSIAQLEAMTFNAAVASAQVAPNANNWHFINIWGDASKGCSKIYTDDLGAANPATVKFFKAVTNPNDITHPEPRIDSTVEYHSRSESNYWRVIVFWEAIPAVVGVSGTPSGRGTVEAKRVPKYTGNEDRDIRSLMFAAPVFIELTTPATSLEVTKIKHDLGRVPNGAVVIKGQPGVYYTTVEGTETYWDETYLYMQFTGTSAPVVLAVF